MAEEGIIADADPNRVRHRGQMDEFLGSGVIDSLMLESQERSLELLRILRWDILDSKLKLSESAFVGAFLLDQRMCTTQTHSFETVQIVTAAQNTHLLDHVQIPVEETAPGMYPQRDNGVHDRRNHEIKG